MRRRTTALSLVIVLGGLLGSAARAGEEAEKAALAAANEWLQLIDDGKIGESWETAASYFKNAVTKQGWEHQVGSVRGPLGRKLSREVQAAQYMTSLPGAPDGEYVVIQYRSSFEKKQEAIETVTPMRDDDGEWRVSGYFIK